MNSNVGYALETLDELIPLVEEAENQLKSARNWSFIDVLGGGFFTNAIKHYKLGKAGNIMEDVNDLMQRLSVQLGNINIPADYRMQMGGFLTFADFFFDGVFVDVYMTSKILSSIDHVRDLKNKLYIVKSRLEEMK